MKLLFENETDAEFEFDPEETARRVIEATLDELGLPYEAEVSLLVTDDTTIRDINKKNRKFDSATDVLSFPAVNFEKPADFSGLGEDQSLFDPDGGELILGDIVINEERVKSQAADYGHSEYREYSFLIVHSVLHLVGYDHMNEADEQVMLGIQKDIMKKLGISR